MKIMHKGKKTEFSEVLASWLVKNARLERRGYDVNDFNEYRIRFFKKLKDTLSSEETNKMACILQMLVDNVELLDDIINFVGVHQNSRNKVDIKDYQDAINLIDVMIIHEK